MSEDKARLSRRFYFWRIAVGVFACMVLLLISNAIVTRPAYAAPRYGVEELTTNVAVNPDASLDVVSHQLINFEDENEGFVWYLGAPANDESFKILSVRVAPVDDGGAFLGGWTRLQMFDVDKTAQGASPGDTASPELRKEGQQPWYSYSISDGMMRCWFPAESGRYMLEVSYTIFNSVSVFRDVAELSWRYAHDSYPVDMNDITLQMNLPIPSDEVAIANSNVYAWGHGPDDGWFDVLEDGTVIYHIESLAAGRHADAHVMFPASWMNNMYKNSPRLFTETNKAEILLEENSWVDAYTRQQNWDFNVRILFLSLAAIVLLVGVVGVIRFGQTTRSRRLLIRLAVILLCMGLAVSLFFWEPVSEWMLFGIAAVVAIASLFFPKDDVLIGQVNDDGTIDAASDAANDDALTHATTGEDTDLSVSSAWDGSNSANDPEKEPRA